MTSLRTLFTSIIALFLVAFGIEASAQNKMLAVVPVEILSNEPAMLTESMVNRVTADFAKYFEKNSTGISVQDTRTTNSILRKNNLSLSDMAAMAPNELAQLLGVDYVVFGDVDIKNQGATTTGSSYSSYENKSNSKNNEGNRDAKSKGYDVTTTTSNTSIKYQTRINIDIYDASGTKIYTQSRVPFGEGSDAYLTGLDYMTKRTPFGTKKK